MNSKQLKGLKVIDLVDGTALGTIDHAVFDPAAQKVVGFSVVGGQSGGLAEDGLMVAAASVHALGPDALTLDNAATAHQAWVDAVYGPLEPLDALAKRKIVTEGGTDLGEVVSIEFDPQSFAMTGVEVSPGFFKAHTHLAGRHIVRVGSDIVVVADAATVAAESTAAK
jgi:uncharacterized protein YrrD